jgi:hypothetical protein
MVCIAIATWASLGGARWQRMVAALVLGLPLLLTLLFITEMPRANAIAVVASGAGALALAGGGPPRLATSLGSLLLAAIVLATLHTEPEIGRLLQLIAAADLVGITAATCLAIVELGGTSLRPPVVSRLARRGGIQVVILAAVTLLALVGDAASSARGLLGVWLLLSETLAGVVLWRVLHRLAHRGKGSRQRVGLLSAALVAMLGLIIAPAVPALGPAADAQRPRGIRRVAEIPADALRHCSRGSFSRRFIIGVLHVSPHPRDSR